MANRTLGPGQPGANPAREPTSPESIGDHAGAERVDDPQARRDDMNMHTSIKPTSPTRADRTAWETALAAYLKGQTDLDAIEDDESPEKSTAGAAATRALDTLLATPAPSHAEMIEKMKIINAEGYHNESKAWEALIADAGQLGQGDLAIDSEEWNTALSKYQAKRAESDAIPPGTPGDDEAVDVWADAMDHLIEEVPAPNIAAVITKLELGIERSDGFGFFENYMEAVIADLRRFADADPMRTFAEAWIDRWQALGGGFGSIFSPSGERDRSIRHIPLEYAWDIPAKHNPLLKPHQWITEEKDHTGAAKMLDSFLSLVPGLSEAVYQVAADKGLIQGLER